MFYFVVDAVDRNVHFQIESPHVNNHESAAVFDDVGRRLAHVRDILRQS